MSSGSLRLRIPQCHLDRSIFLVRSNGTEFNGSTEFGRVVNVLFGVVVFFVSSVSLEGTFGTRVDVEWGFPFGRLELIT